MTDYDVVVIGAGVAGLSAGALLATEGKRVADYVRALRAAGVALPVVLTAGAAPVDAGGPRATIAGLAAALDLAPRAAATGS